MPNDRQFDLSKRHTESNMKGRKTFHTGYNEALTLSDLLPFPFPPPRPILRDSKTVFFGNTER